MCVACSNVRLAGARSPGVLTEQTGNEYWYKRLTDGATELSVSIQNNSQSKQLELASDSSTANGLDNKEEADAKRMETVLFHNFLQVDKCTIPLLHSRLTLFFCRFSIS